MAEVYNALYREVDPAAEYDYGWIRIANILGITEIAELLEVKPDTVSQWRWRGLFPLPDAEIAASELWMRQTVIAWATRTGRILTEEEK